LFVVVVVVVVVVGLGLVWCVDISIEQEGELCSQKKGTRRRKKEKREEVPSFSLLVDIL